MVDVIKQQLGLCCQIICLIEQCVVFFIISKSPQRPFSERSGTTVANSASPSEHVRFNFHGKLSHEWREMAQYPENNNYRNWAFCTSHPLLVIAQVLLNLFRHLTRLRSLAQKHLFAGLAVTESPLVGQNCCKLTRHRSPRAHTLTARSYGP